MSYGRDLFLACAKRIGRREFRAWFKTLLSVSDHQDLYIRTMGSDPNGLYVLGDKDTFFRVMLWMDRRKLQNKVILKDSGHLCSIDQYKAVNDLIVRFMETGAAEELAPQQV